MKTKRAHSTVSPRGYASLSTGESQPSGIQAEARQTGSDDPAIGDLPSFLWNVHKYVNDYIRFADGKANIIFGFSVALLGGLKVIGSLKQLTVLLWSWIPSTVFSLVAVVLLIGAIAFAALSVIPRLQNPPGRGHIFWGAIREHRSADEFWNGLKSRTEDELAKELAGHLFVLSGVANKKYTWLVLSTGCAIGGAVAAAITMILT